VVQARETGPDDATMQRPLIGTTASLVLCVLAGLGTSGTAIAAPWRSAPSAAPFETMQRRAMSLDEAVALVQSRYEAKVVKAETVQQRGREVHRIRLLSPDGRVWTVSVDAASGEIR
jgi:uncharacterized membrane protein YkoI